MDREKFEELYKNILTRKDIKRRPLKTLKESKNNVAFFICNSASAIKELTFDITCLDVKFSRVYVYFNTEKFTEEDLTEAKVVCDLFSDIIVPEYFNYQLNDTVLIKNLGYHIVDNIYVLDAEHTYKTLKTDNNFVTCLSFNQYINKRIYKNSAFIYPVRNEVNTDATRVSDPSFVNPLATDYFIPADSLFGIRFETKPVYMSLNAFLSVFFIISDLKIGYIEENFNVNVYNSSRIDAEINKYLTQDKGMLNRWKEIFPEYKPDYDNADLYLQYIDLVFLNSSTPHITVENVNNVINIMPRAFYNTTIFDNIDQIKYPESNIWSHRAHIIHGEYIKTWYNNNDQLFKRVSLFSRIKPYGLDLLEQSIRYLIDNTESDILMLVGDKVLLTKGLTFDTNNIWTGSIVNGIRTGYINIFNIKMMKEHKIEFNDFDSFIEQLDKEKLPYGTINPDDFGMTLPYDFEKYNGVLFRIAGTKEQIVYNYFIDHYNYYFKSYESNTRYNQL